MSKASLDIGYGNQIFRIGPVCAKRFRRHLRMNTIPPCLRLQREVQGAKMLKSTFVQVAEPVLILGCGDLLLRRWYAGESPENRPASRNEVLALASWLRTNKDSGLAPIEWQEALEIKLDLLAANAEIRHYVLTGTNLLHGDLSRGNILLRDGKPVILDPESVSRGALVWDVAHLSHCLRLHREPGLQILLFSKTGISDQDTLIAVKISKLLDDYEASH